TNGVLCLLTRYAQARYGSACSTCGNPLNGSALQRRQATN
ncbi:MAG: hypothetical protein ACI89D_002586, partial [Bermanella sp.]